MEESRFKVIFDGSLTGEVDEATAKAGFARLFRISEQKAARYFTGEPRVLKKGLDEAAAMEYMIKVAETGCECYIEEMVDGPPAGVDERRRGSERRQRFRREPRPGAIQPDRRLEIRRAEDRRRYRHILNAGGDIPVAFNAYSERALEG